MSTYDFDCGCKFKVLDDKVKECDGLPSLSIDFNNLSHDCESTWDLFASGKTKGVFQLEKSLGKHWSKQVKPTSIEDISALVALIRPATLNAKLNDKNMTQHYSDRKSGLEKFEYIHPSLERILNSTFGIITYQEQTIRISSEIAGFNLQQADTLRKCVTDDTMFISRKRGWTSIRELLDTNYADDFLVMNEKGEKSWKKIKNIWSTGKHNVVNVKTDKGYSVKATTYHQFLTDTGWKARCRLSTQDYLLSPTTIDFDGEDKISEDMSIVIAGLITEGYFSDKTKKGKPTGCHFTNYDKQTMSVFCSAYFKEFGFHPKLSDNNRVASVNAKSRDIINKILDFGFSDSKYIPSVMMSSSKETMRKFLSFMLNTEGGFTKKTGYFEYCSKSEKCINQVKILLTRFGIISNILKKYDKKYQSYYYRLYINNIKEQKKLKTELTCLWSTDKIKALDLALERGDKGFSSICVPQSIVKKLANQYPTVVSYESGRIYKEKITTDKFSRLVSKINDKEYSKFSENIPVYCQIETLDETYRQRETFDFSMEDENTPYIVANGLVIHNSMGKKDAKLMSSLKTEFIDGCENTGLISRIQGEELFDNIQKSNKYNFNLSHAVAYGETSYWTAYVKAHFPLHFCCSYLYYAREKMKPQEEIDEIITDAKNLDIDILTPDIRYLFNGDAGDFALNSMKINFGVRSIKGCGDKNIEKLLAIVTKGEQLINKSIHEWTWLELLLLALTNVSKTVVNGLISVGGCSHFGLSRQKMLHEYAVASDLNEKELSILVPHCSKFSTLEECLNYLESSGGVKKQRLEKINKFKQNLLNPPFSLDDSPNWIAEKEQFYLGYPLSCMKVESINISGNTTCKEFNNGKDLKVMNVVGEIKSTREFVLKKGNSIGKKMCFGTIQDPTSCFDYALSPEKYEELRNVAYKGNIVMMTGKRSKNGNFQVERMVTVE